MKAPERMTKGGEIGEQNAHKQAKKKMGGYTEFKSFLQWHKNSEALSTVFISAVTAAIFLLGRYFAPSSVQRSGWVEGGNGGGGGNGARQVTRGGMDRQSQEAEWTVFRGKGIWGRGDWWIKEEWTRGETQGQSEPLNPITTTILTRPPPCPRWLPVGAGGGAAWCFSWPRHGAS